MAKQNLGYTEEQFQQQVIDLARFLGYRVAHFRPAKTDKGWRTPVSADGKGFPDLFLVRPGRLIVAEIKSETGKLSPEQEAWLEAIDAGGGEAYCWRPSEWDNIVEVLTASTMPNRLEAIMAIPPRKHDPLL